MLVQRRRLRTSNKLTLGVSCLHDLSTCTSVISVETVKEVLLAMFLRIFFHWITTSALTLSSLNLLLSSSSTASHELLSQFSTCSE